jgi:hypothetical protein
MCGAGFIVPIRYAVTITIQHGLARLRGVRRFCEVVPSVPAAVGHRCSRARIGRSAQRGARGVLIETVSQ